MQTKIERRTLCVLIARFQVPNLTEAHADLVNEALANHPRVLILLGLSPTQGTINNPLSFAPRKQMLLERFPHDRYPQLEIAYVKDHVSNDVWSKKVDELIRDHLGPNDTAILYGGRDSFLSAYTTKTYPTRELTSKSYVSGTEIRRQVSEAPQSTPDFRAGAIWATFQRYPTVFPTVDIMPIHRETKQVLLARKSGEAKYRFVGGFVDPKDPSYEAAAERELLEETGMDIHPETLAYMGSAKIDDWRYRGEVDCIITHLYVADALHTEAVAADDIAEVRWFDWADLNVALFVPNHADLYTAFIDKIAKTYKWTTPKGNLNIL